MASSEFLKNYDLVESTIRKLYDSRLRLAILDALKDGPMRLSDLRREVNANAPNTSAKSKDLEGMGLVERKEGVYSISEWGQLIRDNLSDSIQLIAVHEKFREYWDTHSIAGIPKELRKELDVYLKAELIKPKKENITYAEDHFVELLYTIEKRFWGLTPVFRPEYIGPIMAAVKKGADVILILQSDLIKSVLDLVPPEAKKALLTFKNLKIYSTDEDLKLGLVVSEKFCTIGFESKISESTFMDMNPESFDPKTIEWETKLFEYYKKQAKLIKLGDYL